MSDGYYCEACDHPNGYHKSGPCSMPVIPGTTLPLGPLDRVSDKCRCIGNGPISALDLAREEGRQEVRDAIIAQMDIYAPHAVEWWKNFNAIIQFDPKGR